MRPRRRERTRGRPRRHRARPRERLVHPRPRSRGVRSRVRRGVRRRARRRRRQRHRRHRPDPARARHRARRRGDHHAAVGGVHGAGDHDGRRAAGLRRHRPGPSDASIRRPIAARSRRGRARSCPCILRTGRRHGGASTRGLAPRPGASSKTAARRISRPPAGGRSERSASPGAFSFYPTKNLGALGDGGAVVTNDARAGRTRSGGCATAARRDRYHHEEPGVNSRLDEMQAAILRARLPFLAGLDRRAAPRSRQRYRRALADGARVACCRSATRATSTICSSCAPRGARRCSGILRRRGIETLVHYPVPIPRQPALAGAASRGRARSGDRACDEVLSLPLHPASDDVRDSTRSPPSICGFQEG